MPMPAAKSIAAQLSVEYSGFSPSSPSGIAPNREKARHSSTMTRPMAKTVNTQPRLAITQLSAALETAKTFCGARIPQMTKATTSPPTTTTIGRSTR